MADSITGPGISSGGGASEIAAVSIGVYVVDYTGPGFAALRANIAAQGGVLGEEMGTAMGQAANKAAADAIEGKGKGAAKADAQGGMLAGITKQLRSIRVLGALLFAPRFIEDAFKFGTAIGTAIWGPVQADGLKTMAEIEKIVKSSHERLTASGDKARPGAPVLDPGLESARNRLKISREIVAAREEEIAKIKGYAEADRRISEDDTYGSAEQRGALKERSALLGQIIIQTRKLAEENANVAALERQIADITSRIATDEDRITKAKKDQIERERMLKTESAVLAERTAADIGRMRQLLELSIRQRFPTIPGGSVIYGNQGAVR